MTKNVRGARFSVLGSRFSVLGSRFSVLGSRFSVLGSRFSVQNSEFCIGHWSLVIRHSSLVIQKEVAPFRIVPILRAPMSKKPGLSKTRKAVVKRFKITGTGKIIRRRQGKRHLLVSKNRKRKNSLKKGVLVHKTDMAAIKANMPWA
jgi:large subunit ribosomal protein L35